MNYEKDIQLLKEQIDKAQMNKVRAETRLEALEKEKEEILQEMAQFGIKPEELDSEIEKLEAEIQTLLSEAQNLLPKE